MVLVASLHSTNAEEEPKEVVLVAYFHLTNAEEELTPAGEAQDAELLQLLYCSLEVEVEVVVLYV